MQDLTQMIIERSADWIVWGSYFAAAGIGFGLEAIFGFTRRWRK